MSSLANKPKRVRYGKKMLAEGGELYTAIVTGLDWVIRNTEDEIIMAGEESNVSKRNKAVKLAMMGLGVRFSEEKRITKLEKEVALELSLEAFKGESKVASHNESV